MLGGESIWRCSHLRSNNPPETSNRQGHLYHHICLFPQVWPPRCRKGLLWWVPSSIAGIPTLEILILLDHMNGHVGKASAWQGMHSGHGWGTRDKEGESVLEFAMSCNLVNSNTCFEKWPNHLITHTSGEGRTWINYVLFRKTFCKHVRYVKIIPGEEITKQHHLLVCDFCAGIPPTAKEKSVPRLRTWLLREPQV